MRPQRYARGARVGEQVAVVGVGCASGLADAGQPPLGPGARVHRSGAQSQAIDLHHLGRPEVSLRNLAARSAPADAGQRTVRRTGSGLSSMGMAGSGSG